MSEPNLVFTHPKVSQPLHVEVNPNQIEWSYGLNVANFPTYGGEVIQILSSYVDDMMVSGNVETYRQMESIYKWFINYIHLATVGEQGSGRYNVQPVSMYYAERGWQFNIYPTGLPGFRYGTEVVAPEWQLQATVVDPAQGLLGKITDKASKEEDLKLFGKATGNIGFEEHNPFSDPEGQDSKRAEEILGKKPKKRGINALADEYNKLLPAYLEGDFSDLIGNFSKPVRDEVEEEAEEAVKAKKTKEQAKGKNG